MLTDDSARTRRLLACGLAVFAFLCGFHCISCVDIGFHVRTGELVWQTRAIPVRNTFSFTRPDAPWLLHQWAPGVFFYLVDRAAGIPGLVLAKGLLAGLLALLLLWAARAALGRDDAWPWALWAVTLVLPLVRMRLFARPFLFSALGLAALTVLMLPARRRATRLTAVAVLFAAWANVHAGVAYGWAYLAAFAGGCWLDALTARQPARRPAAQRLAVDATLAAAVSLAAAFAAVALVNPSGISVILLPFAYFTDPFWQNLIQEFHPPAGIDARLLYGLAGVAAAALALARARLRWRLLAPALLFLAMALRSQRIILMAAVTAAPLLATSFAAAAARLRTRPPVWAHAAALPVLWVMLTALWLARDPVRRLGPGINESLHPLGVYAFLDREVPPQPLYNDMRYGAGLLWFSYPRFRPFIDGRCEAYPRDWWVEAMRTELGLDGWRDTFAAYGIHAALVAVPSPGSESRLAAELQRDPDWALVAFDDHAMLFLEHTALNAPLIARHAFRLLSPLDRRTEAIRPATVRADLAEARQAVLIAPGSLYARTAMARAMLTAGRYLHAADLYSGLIVSGAAGPASWRDYAYSLYMSGELHTADLALDRMLRQRIEPGFACYLKHFIAWQGNRADAARTWLRRAIAHEPGNASYRARFADCFPGETPAP